MDGELFSSIDQVSATDGDGTVVAIAGREVVEVRLKSGRVFRVNPGVSLVPDGRSKFIFTDGTKVRDGTTRIPVSDDDLRWRICRLAAAGLMALEGAVVDWKDQA
jgi:hypothetical protein